MALAWSGVFSPRPRRAIEDRESAADFERCLQLGGTDLQDDELFATLTALTGYYIARADLRRFGPGARVAARRP